IKMMNDRNWKTMKTYLKTCVSQDEIFNVKGHNSNDSDKINKVSFIKNFYLGVSHFKEGEYDEAYNCFIEANKINQTYQLHYSIALCFMKKGMLDDAVLFLDGVITKNPNFFSAHYNLIR